MKLLGGILRRLRLIVVVLTRELLFPVSVQLGASSPQQHKNLIMISTTTQIDEWQSVCKFDRFDHI